MILLVVDAQLSPVGTPNIEPQTLQYLISYLATNNFASNLYTSSYLLGGSQT